MHMACTLYGNGVPSKSISDEMKAEAAPSVRHRMRINVCFAERARAATAGSLYGKVEFVISERRVYIRCSVAIPGGEWILPGNLNRTQNSADSCLYLAVCRAQFDTYVNSILFSCLPISGPKYLCACLLFMASLVKSIYLG